MKRFMFKGLSDFPQLDSSPAFPSKEGKVDCLSEDEFLVQLYLAEKQSIRDLAQRYSCSQATIRKRLVRSGVEIRSKSEAIQLKWAEEDYIRKQCGDRGRTKFRVGDRIVLDTGYVGIYWPDSRGGRRFPFLKQHRVVAEKFLRRRLKHAEHIHHGDGNKTNNRASNLFFFRTGSLHSEYHARFGCGLLRDLSKALRSEAKRFLGKYAIPVTEFRSRLREIRSVIVRCLGNLLESLIGFLSPVRARDGPPIPAAACLKE